MHSHYEDLVSQVEKSISMLHQLMTVSIRQRAALHGKSGMLLILSEIIPSIEDVISDFSERNFERSVSALNKIDTLLTDGFDLARLMNDWDDEDAFVDARAILIEITELVPVICRIKANSASQLCS